MAFSCRCRSPFAMFQILFLSIFLSFWFMEILGSDNCDSYGASEAYLNSALELINRAKSYFPEDDTIPGKKTFLAADCEDIFFSGHNRSGVHTIWPRSRLLQNKPLNVYCDMDTDDGGWTVIQRRGNFGNSIYYFYKDWESYKTGFGDVKEDFWLGNDNIFALTNQGEYSIRFDLENQEGEKKYAHYESFWIDNESQKYRLHVDGYSGNAGDCMISWHNDRQFSTKDQDNDLNVNKSCAQMFKGAWWYSKCYQSNLNGMYDNGLLEDYRDGIRWFTFTTKNDTLKANEMKIRPKNFKKVLTRAKNM